MQVKKHQQSGAEKKKKKMKTKPARHFQVGYMHMQLILTPSQMNHK